MKYCNWTLLTWWTPFEGWIFSFYIIAISIGPIDCAKIHPFIKFSSMKRIFVRKESKYFEHGNNGWVTRREEHLRIQKISNAFTNQPMILKGVGDVELPWNLVPIYKESYHRYLYGSYPTYMEFPTIVHMFSYCDSSFMVYHSKVKEASLCLYIISNVCVFLLRRGYINTFYGPHYRNNDYSRLESNVIFLSIVCSWINQGN